MNDIFDIDEATLDALHARLVERARSQGLVDVSYRTLDTPIGPLLLAATETGLVKVAAEAQDFDVVLETLGTKLGARVMRDEKHFDTVATQLDEYFAGTRQAFDVPLDYSLSSGFRQVVQHYLPHIAYGSTATYKQVATAVGSPNAVRAVGTACATNPLLVVVPCHRVLRSDGGLGGYAGGVAAKERLLRLEGAA